MSDLSRVRDEVACLRDQIDDLGESVIPEAWFEEFASPYQLRVLEVDELKRQLHEAELYELREMFSVLLGRIEILETEKGLL